MVNAKKIFLVGESTLVQEWSAFCSSRGWSIVKKINSSEKEIKCPQDVLLCAELTFFDKEQKKKNLFSIRAQHPLCTILSSSVITPATEQLLWLNKESNLIGISAFPTLIEKELIELAIPSTTLRENIQCVEDFFVLVGKQFSVVQDRVGMVLPRILCMLVNESFFALQEEIATPEAIDTAMKLGTNYPFGPIEWGERVGYEYVIKTLQAMYDEYGEERYRIAPLLKQFMFTQKI
jgi:3-hydroxybutyryl-CoA dehydrogenase